MRIKWKKVAEYALEKAYQDEVVSTGMESLIIGEGEEYANKADWIKCTLDTWLDDMAEIEKQSELFHAVIEMVNPNNPRYKPLDNGGRIE